MRNRCFTRIASTLFTLLLLAGTRPALATDPADLCTGNPCVISGAVTLDPGSSLDFGDAIDLVFASNAVVQLNDAFFSAGSITLESGARLVGGGPNCAGGASMYATARGLRMLSSGGTSSRIDAGGTCPGYIELVTDPVGDMEIGGVIVTTGSGPGYPSGGSITLYSAGDLSMTGRLTGGSSGLGFGESITLTSNGPAGVMVDGTIEASSQLSGGIITVEAYGGAPISLDGSFDIRGGGDSGGFLNVYGEGDFFLGGVINGQGSTGNGQYNCSGDPQINVEIPGDMTIGATMQLNGNGGQSCPSGFLYLQVGGKITQLPTSKISAIGEGFASGGALQASAGGDVVLYNLNLSSQDQGGFLDVQSGGAISILGSVQTARGGGVNLAGCDVYVAAKGLIDSRHQGGGIDLTASETLTVVGRLQAAQAPQLRIREGAPTVSGTVSPPAQVIGDPGLPDCRPGPSCTPGGSCGDGVVQCGEECDDGPDNGTPASDCSASCVETPPALRIPGGGARPTDCPYEWSAALDPSDVAVDPIGIPKVKQKCQDNDPSCDFEPAPGVCRFHLWSCLGGADARLACAATQVSSVTIDSPRANSTKPADVATRSALQAALTALGLPAGPGEECSPRYDVSVGVGQKAVKLKTKAKFANNKTDGDSLELTCTP